MSSFLTLLLTALWNYYSGLTPPLPAGTFPGVLADRTYLAHVPASRPARPALVIALHGAGATGRQMEKLSGLSQIADRAGFLVLYPDGRNRRWNDGRNVPEVTSDDVGFLDRLIDHAVSQWNVNPRQVYVVGFSNGATMAYRLACEVSAKVAAIASVSGSLAREVFDRCRPAKPVSILSIHGTNDPIVPFGGGEIRFRASGDRGVVTSQQTNLDLWSSLNGCSESPADRDIPDFDRDGVRARRATRTACRLGTRVESFTVFLGGHKYPGVDNLFGFLPAVDKALGPTCWDFNASQVAWDFFASRPPRFSQAELETLVAEAFRVYSNEIVRSGSPSMQHWVNFAVSRKLETASELVDFLISEYHSRPATAETIVNRMFLVFSGRLPSKASQGYWSEIVRSYRWTFQRLLSHFIAAYLRQPGSAEEIARVTLFDFSGLLPTQISIDYWANAIRQNGWTYSELIRFFLTTYLNQPGSAEAIARAALLAFAGPSGLTGASIAYWANAVRTQQWTYLQLMEYFRATY